MADRYTNLAHGAPNWDETLNANFDALDVDVELRDVEANLGDYSPEGTAKFFAVDTGAIYVHDGSGGWEYVGSSGLTAFRDAASFSGADGGAQIQAAIDDLPPEGGIVYIAAEGPDTNGRWDLSAPVVPATNTTLMGVPGATRLYLTDATDNDAIQTADNADGTPKENIVIDGLHVEGNSANQAGINQTYIYGSCGIRFINCVDSVIRNCSTNDTKKHGIEVKMSQHISIDNCVVENAGDDGISLSDTLFDTATSENIIVTGCRASGATDNGMEVDDGPINCRFIECYAHSNGTNGFVIHTHRANNPPQGTTEDTYAPAAPRGIYFTDCASVDNTRLGFAVGHHSSGTPRDYFLNGVYARGNGESPFRDEISSASDPSVEITNVNINDFYFEGTSLQNETGGWTAGFSLQRAVPWNDVTISNGIVTGTLGYGMNIAAGSINGLTVDNVIFEAEQFESYVIYAATADAGYVVEDFRFANCVVKDGPVGGLAFNIGASDSVINGQVSNCTFKNNGRSDRTGSQWDAGIVLAGSGTLENISFIGNNSYDDDAGTQEYGIYRASEDYCTFVGNVLHGNVSGQWGGSLGTNSVEAANITR